MGYRKGAVPTPDISYLFVYSRTLIEYKVSDFRKTAKHVTCFKRKPQWNRVGCNEKNKKIITDELIKQKHFKF